MQDMSWNGSELPTKWLVYLSRIFSRLDRASGSNPWEPLVLPVDAPFLPEGVGLLCMNGVDTNLDTMYTCIMNCWVNKPIPHR